MIVGDDARENYLKVHTSPHSLRLLCWTVFSLVRDYHMRHIFSNFLWKEEENIHNNRGAIFICLRSKLGSDVLFTTLLDSLPEPGCLKKVVSRFTDKGLFCMHKLSPVVLKFMISIFRVILFNLDMVKDLVFWVFLYSRINILLESSRIDGLFVVILIWFNLATIFFAQSMMGTVLLKRANRILKVPQSVPAKVFLYVTLFLSIPFLPCLLLLQVSSIATQQSKLILEWKKDSNSPSSVAEALLTSEKEREFITETYAQLRMLEGVCESLPQIVLLIAYFFVSLDDPDSLSISDDVHSNDRLDLKGVTFFALNILYSMLTLLFSLVNVVNTAKGGQLSLSQKACLGLVYLFQLLARLVPVCLVIFFTIVKRIPQINGLLLLIVPIIFHLLCQYLVTYYTAPTFRQLDTFQQVIHMLSNTMLVFPLRTKKTGKQEHRNREIFWSIALMTLEIVSTVVVISGHFVRDLPSILLTILLPVILLLLCAYLSQSLYYSCFHTFSLINKPHYSSCYPMAGSRQNILEEVEEEEEFVELETTGENVGHDSLPAGCWHGCKTKLCCSCGSCKDSVEKELAMEEFVRGSSKSLPDMMDTTKKTYQARVSATL